MVRNHLGANHCLHTTIEGHTSDLFHAHRECSRSFKTPRQLQDKLLHHDRILQVSPPLVSCQDCGKTTKTFSEPQSWSTSSGATTSHKVISAKLQDAGGGVQRGVTGHEIQVHIPDVYRPQMLLVVRFAARSSLTKVWFWITFGVPGEKWFICHKYAGGGSRITAKPRNMEGLGSSLKDAEERAGVDFIDAFVLTQNMWHDYYAYYGMLKNPVRDWFLPDHTSWGATVHKKPNQRVLCPPCIPSACVL